MCLNRLHIKNGRLCGAVGGGQNVGMDAKNKERPLTVDSVLAQMCEVFSDEGREIVRRELKSRLERDPEAGAPGAAHPAEKAGDK